MFALSIFIFFIFFKIFIVLSVEPPSITIIFLIPLKLSSFFLVSTITINSNSTPLLDCVNLEITKIEDCKDNLDNYVKVFINGAWIGMTDEPEKLYLSLKDKKHKGIINIYTSVIFDYKNCEIRVCNDGGRLIRPVLKVKNNNVLVVINKMQILFIQNLLIK